MAHPHPWPYRNEKCHACERSSGQDILEFVGTLAVYVIAIVAVALLMVVAR